MVDWSKPYRKMADLQAVNAQERADRVTLAPSRRAPGRLTPQEAETTLAAEARLRNENDEMRRMTLVLMTGMLRYSASQTPEQQQRLLGELRAHYGDCVVAPSVEGVDPNDQLNGMPSPAKGK
jgi:hypothetical protein